MKSFWDKDAQQELRDRVRRLPSTAKPLWGSMDLCAMLSHLSDGVRMAMGTLPVENKNMIVRFSPIKQMLIYLFPFPKGLPTAPELIARRCDDVEEERASLLELMNELALREGTKAFPLHPAFGKLSPRAWGVLGYRHLDHHLRQFGG